MGMFSDIAKRRQIADYYVPRNEQAIRDNARVGSVGAPGGILSDFTSNAPTDYLANLLAAGAMTPGTGDFIGPLADLHMYYTDPSSRTWSNYGMSALGALPFVPSLASIKAVHGTFDPITSDWRTGTHFGTPQAAFDRVTAKSSTDDLLEGNPAFYPVELDDSKVLSGLTDPEANQPDYLLNYLKRNDIIDDNELKQLKKRLQSLYLSSYNVSDSKAFNTILEYLYENKDYKLLEYLNNHEDKGSLSYVITNPSVARSYFGEALNKAPDRVARAAQDPLSPAGKAVIGNAEKFAKNMGGNIPVFGGKEWSAGKSALFGGDKIADYDNVFINQDIAYLLKTRSEMSQFGPARVYMEDLAQGLVDSLSGFAGDNTELLDTVGKKVDTYLDELVDNPYVIYLRSGQEMPIAMFDNEEAAQAAYKKFKEYNSDKVEADLIFIDNRIKPKAPVADPLKSVFDEFGFDDYEF